MKMLNVEDLAVIVTNILTLLLLLCNIVKLSEKSSVQRTYLTNQCITTALYLLIITTSEDEAIALKLQEDASFRFITSTVRTVVTFEMFWCVFVPWFNVIARTMLDVEYMTSTTTRTTLLVSWVTSFCTGVLCELLRHKLYPILFLYNFFGALLLTFLNLSLKKDASLHKVEVL